MAKDVAWRDIAATFRYERDHLGRWMRQTNTEKRKAMLFMLILGVLTINFAIAIPGAANKTLPILLTLVCAGCVLAVFFVSRNKKGANTLEVLYHGGAEYRVFLRQNELQAQAEGEEKHIPYDERTQVRERVSFFDVRHPDAGVFILPKTALTDEQSEAYSLFLRDKLGKNYQNKS